MAWPDLQASVRAFTSAQLGKRARREAAAVAELGGGGSEEADKDREEKRRRMRRRKIETAGLWPSRINARCRPWETRGNVSSTSNPLFHLLIVVAIHHLLLIQRVLLFFLSLLLRFLLHSAPKPASCVPWTSSSCTSMFPSNPWRRFRIDYLREKQQPYSKTEMVETRAE